MSVAVEELGLNSAFFGGLSSVSMIQMLFKFWTKNRNGAKRGNLASNKQ